ncbi:MAG: polymer-forming cytoskeletal protein [Nannocystis sp.]|nr:polymer-forming cytoskeletal protein [Nannocystis sp.]MBA3547511.1 polymer-forming cytoskeletal protein [Nannocystis sp.]
MAQKTKNNLPSADGSAEVVTHIGPGTRIVGRLSGQEDLRVHGTVEGAVRLSATLFVEPEGVILAEVHARDVVVSGTVVGNLHAENAIVLTASARVVGDLRSPRISVEPGAAFRGSISMEPPDAEALEAEANASRSYGATRSASAPLVRGAISERPSNGDSRRAAPAPARQQAQQQQPQSVRLPPRRAQAFTARPEPRNFDPNHFEPRNHVERGSSERGNSERSWAAREPVRATLPPAPSAALPPARRPAFEEETIIVQHAAIRSSDDRSRRRAEALPPADHDDHAATPDEPRKKVAKPKPLARGKHKVERVD